MTNDLYKLSDLNYTWYDLGKPEKEGIFNQDFYNKKVIKIMDEKFITYKNIGFRHGSTDLIDGEKILNANGIEQTKNLAKNIVNIFGNKKEIIIYFGEGTSRMEESFKILEEELKKVGIKVIKGIDSKLETGEKGDKVLKEIYKKSYEAMNFVYEKGEENSGISLTLLHSTSAPNLKNIKINDIQEIHVKNDDVKNGDSEVFDFNKGKLILNNSDIIELNLGNYEEIINILKNNEKFIDIIDKFKNKEIDLKYLQNQINFIFSKDPELFKGFIYLLPKVMKQIINQLKISEELLLYILLNADDDFCNSYELKKKINFLKWYFKLDDLEGMIIANIDKINYMIQEVINITSNYNKIKNNEI